MKKTLMLAGLAALMSTSAMAQNIGVSVARFDDNGLTVMRNGMTAHVETLDGVTMQMEDATDDVAKQLDQINNFIASGVDAIIVNAVDTNATEAMSTAAAAARRPARLREPPAGQHGDLARRSGIRCLQRNRIRHTCCIPNVPATAC